ncbi:ATP-binding protein [Streptomyces californicus]|uniref:ATP-binding protein n=1 Tax=Streptomyces californicus TaxID=67351 RepID=UPI00099DABA9|nr:ATP-binding protein [Streptomyces californicus]QRV59534.1 ATP-binding protein [Streptomyces californicus]
MIWEIDHLRPIARIVLISEEQNAAHVEFMNGNMAVCTSDYSTELGVGDVVYVQDDQLEKAPDDLWIDTPWVGVVKLLVRKKVVVEVGGQMRVMPRPKGLRLRIGNTVEGSGRDVVKRVLSEDPIRYLDLPDVDDHIIDQFKDPLDRDYSFDEFGGSEHIVDRARELIETPLTYHKELAEIGARPIKGVLFTGDPGTGKTMLARIIASKAGATFYQISGPQIMSKWLGQSEEVIRKIFIDASQQERAIVFFDEIDSLATQRSDESHEASRRVVGQLLASMDGFKSETNVVVIATTNRPQDIDYALRRPGRFDWTIHFSLPTQSDREQILAKSAPPGTASNLSHSVVAEKTESWSPAELVAIWSEAALLAVADGRKKIHTEDYIGGYERVSAQRERKKEDLILARQDVSI